MQAELMGRDVFARHTDDKGNSHVQCHRVWDGERFFERRQADAVKVGGKVEQITPEQYKKERH